MGVRTGLGKWAIEKIIGSNRDRQGFAGQQAQQPQQKIALQDKLLHERPYDVIARVHRRAESCRGADVAFRCARRGRRRGRRASIATARIQSEAPQTFAAHAQRGPLVAPRPGGSADPREGEPVESSLRGIGGPDGRHDEAISYGEFQQIAPPCVCLVCADRPRCCCSCCQWWVLGFLFCRYIRASGCLGRQALGTLRPTFTIS